MNDRALIATEKRGHVMLAGFDRPEKLNAFTVPMLRQLGEAYTAYEDDEELRCLVVHASGRDFTAGLDLANVAPHVAAGESTWPTGGVNPWGVDGGRERTKPVVVAIQGRCFTLGIELALASDIVIASEDASFAQVEIARGIFPFGGATMRAPLYLGWGNAMRFLLTAESFGVAEAHRIGLVQEIVPRAGLLERAVALAERIAAQAPLGVRATLASSRKAVRDGFDAAERALRPQIKELMQTADAQEGLMSFVERRPARFTGR